MSVAAALKTAAGVATTGRKLRKPFEHIRQAAQHGDHVTPAVLDGRLNALDACLDVGLAKLRADLTWRMLAVAGLVMAAIRLIP